jgi:hypothetical protein
VLLAGCTVMLFVVSPFGVHKYESPKVVAVRVTEEPSHIACEGCVIGVPACMYMVEQQKLHKHKNQVFFICFDIRFANIIIILK